MMFAWQLAFTRDLKCGPSDGYFLLLVLGTLTLHSVSINQSSSRCQPVLKVGARGLRGVFHLWEDQLCHVGQLCKETIGFFCVLLKIYLLFS